MQWKSENSNCSDHTRIWRSDDRASWYILIIKPTRCTNFSNLFLEQKPTCFGQFLCPSSGVFHCTHSNGICHTGFADSLRAGSAWNILILLASCQHIYHCCVYSEKTPDDGQKNCPKHAEFYSKNKFLELVHIVGFITNNSEICIIINSTKIILSIFQDLKFSECEKLKYFCI